MAGHEKAFQNAFIVGLQANGWVYSGSEGCPDYEKGSAIISSDLKKWITSTQLNEWKNLVSKVGNEDYALKALIHELVVQRMETPNNNGGDTKATGGTYNVLLNGIKVHGVEFKLFEPKPVNTGNTSADLLYRNMIFRVVSELYYCQFNSNSIDLVFFINGIPVGTAELKAPISGQGIVEAEKQYREDRIPGRDLILHSSAGALFHFAVATNKTSLTTALCGDKTRFIPFNTAIDNSEYFHSNPLDGYATSYLWKEVLTKDNLSLILFGMMRNVQDGGIPQTRFPRYHQLDNLRKIVEAVTSDGGRRNYLSQHAPGSGKSDEIANLAYALSRLEDESRKPLYSSIIIITNRTVLDDQIKVLLKGKAKEFFTSIDKKNNGVSKSSDLAEKLLSVSCPRIMSVTAQTFTGTLIETMRKQLQAGSKLSGSYAIIVDEAHDGETGKQHVNMYRALLGASFDEDETLLPDEVAESAEGDSELIGTANMETSVTERNALPTLNFFAYTATPNADTLRVFGHAVTDAARNVTYKPFHTYSMHQAREEGYINDVLANYVTHDRYVKIDIDEVTYEGDRIVDFTAGRKDISKWMATRPEVKEAIIKIILQKMKNIVLPSLKGEGKAMLSCSSRNEALVYKRLIDAAVRSLPEEDRFDTLVAYSGSLKDPESGDDVTELDERVNQGLGKRQDIASAFDDEDKNFRLLIVANKYQVGFDQPKLVCMFLDKPLKDINLIQTTARVNRKIPGKDNVYIFDFVNDKEQVVESFKKFDEDATLALSVDLSPTTLDALLNETSAFGIHTEDDIEQFYKECVVWDNPSSTKAEKSEASAKMSGIIDRCSEKFQKKKDEGIQEVDKYKALLRKFGSVYSLLSITRSELTALSAIYRKYGKASRFFSSLSKALVVSRESDAVYSVDVNALCLQRYEVVPQGAIGGLSTGTVEMETANYSGTVSHAEIASKLGPLEVLINEINDYPEIPEDSGSGVKDLMKTVITSMEADATLQAWAEEKKEASFVSYKSVQDKVRSILVKQSKSKTETGRAAKLILAKQKNDPTVLIAIAKTLFQVFKLESETPQSETPPPKAVLPMRAAAITDSTETRLPSWVRFMN